MSPLALALFSTGAESYGDQLWDAVKGPVTTVLKWLVYVLLVGRRILTESVGDTDPKAPDFVGVGLMSLALASLVLAISEGSTWGWTDGRILAAVQKPSYYRKTYER